MEACAKGGKPSSSVAVSLICANRWALIECPPLWMGSRSVVALCHASERLRVLEARPSHLG